MLEEEIKEVESTLYHWQKARRFLFDNPAIVTDLDRRDVTRKLMRLDVALDDLHRQLPEAVVEGDEECPQEMAAALAVYLRAAGSLAGQDYPLDEATLQAAKEENLYTFDECVERGEGILKEFLGSRAISGAIAANLCDAFEAGYYAAKERM